jgi:hypothetical protein
MNTGRRSRCFAFALLAVLLASCGDSDVPGSRADPPGVPDFAVVAGEDGVALVGDDWFEPVAGLDGSSAGYRGAMAVGVTASSAAVLAAGHIALVRAHQPAVVADCAKCAGIAVTDEFIVSSRKSVAPGNGIEIVLFTRDLKPSRTVSADRLEERTTTDYPAENTESPITLAAGAGRITLGYLSREGGNRRGPSVVAQYDFDGKLLGNASVGGTLGRSAVSPDGHRVALGVGGSSGACITLSSPVVVDLESLRVQKIQPDVPGVLPDSGRLAWFMLTDLLWRENTLVATGEVHTPPEGETCDPHPQIWRRGFDPATGQVRDTGEQPADATRWIGPGCDDVLTASGGYQDAVLLRKAKGTETKLGNYNHLRLGRPLPAECGQA